MGKPVTGPVYSGHRLSSIIIDTFSHRSSWPLGELEQEQLYSIAFHPSSSHSFAWKVSLGERYIYLWLNSTSAYRVGERVMKISSYVCARRVQKYV